MLVGKSQRSGEYRIAGRFVLLVIALLSASFHQAVSQSTPNSAERQQLLAVRQQVWESYFSNDQTKLRQLIGDGFLTINPDEAQWQNRDEFLAGAKAFAGHHGKLVSLVFPRTEIQSYGDVAVLYSQVRITMEEDGKSESLDCRSTEIFQRRNGGWVNTGAHVDSGK
jgi:ketosteroid isomerase-like protein